MKKIDIFKTPLFHSDFKFTNLNRVKTYLKDLGYRSKFINREERNGKLLYVDILKYMPTEINKLILHIEQCLSEVKTEYRLNNLLRLNDIYFTKGNPNLNKIALATMESGFKGYYFFDVQNPFTINFKNTNEMIYYFKYMRSFENSAYNSFDFSVPVKNDLLIIVPAWVETNIDHVYDEQYILKFNIRMVE